MLAWGSHDNNIYIYDVDRHYALRYKLRGHNSYVVSVDWSADCSTIRSVWGAYELLFFNIATGKQVTGGGSATVDTIWATNSAKFGWWVDGIFPMYADGTHINDVDWSIDGSVIATADDYGLLNIYRNPARKGHQPRCYRAHSEHVVRAKFTHDASRIISIGGYDKTIMIWKRDTSKYIAPSYKENFIQ